MNGESELRSQNARENADLAHRDGDRRELPGHAQMKHPRRLGQGRRRRGDLDDVRIEPLTLLGDVGNVDRRGLEVMITDDPLRLAEPADLVGNVHLEIDVIDPQRDRLAKQLLPLLLVAPPEPAVDPSADGENHRRGAILENSLQVRIAPQAVDP